MAKKRTRRTTSSSLSPVPAIGLLLASGAAAGILYNVLSPRGIFRPAPVESVKSASISGPAAAARSESSVKPGAGETGREVAPNPDAQTPASAVEILDLAGMKKVSAEGSAIIVDARSPQSYEFGHMPGAINIPAAGFEAAYAWQSRLLPPNVRIVVYCTSANCDESEQVLAALAGKGHRRLLHYKGGWNEWELAGLPVEKGRLQGSGD